MGNDWEISVKVRLVSVDLGLKKQPPICMLQKKLTPTSCALWGVCVHARACVHWEPGLHFFVFKISSGVRFGPPPLLPPPPRLWSEGPTRRRVFFGLAAEIALDSLIVPPCSRVVLLRGCFPYDPPLRPHWEPHGERRIPIIGWDCDCHSERDQGWLGQS